MAEKDNKIIQEFKKAEEHLNELANSIESLDGEKQLTEKVTQELKNINENIVDIVQSISKGLDYFEKSAQSFDKFSTELSGGVEKLMASAEEFKSLETSINLKFESLETFINSKFEEVQESVESLDTKIGYLRQVQAGIRKSAK